MPVAKIVNSIFEIYFWLVIVRIFLTWINTIRWENPPFNFLRAVVDPFLSPFRSLIPALGGLDFSPIVAILFLHFVQAAIVNFLVSMGL